MMTNPISLMGVEVDVRAGAADTGGAVSILAQTAAPGAGSPLHTVPASKVLVALAGELVVRIGDDERAVRAGDTVFIPAGVAHCFRNTGATPARLVMVLVPGGHEAFLAELAAATRGPTPDRAAMRAACEAHGVVMC